MSPRAWIRRGAAAAAASAALVMAFQPAATAAPRWWHDGSAVTHVKYSPSSKHWKQGNNWRHRSRWAPPAPETNQASETNPEPPVAAPANPAPAGQGDTADQIVALTNAERAKAGLAPLRRNGCLTSAAQNWSNVMRSQQRMYHSNLRTLMGNCSLNSVGENVAYGGRSAAETVQMWMDSPGHRANILNEDYNQIGVGAAADGYSTQMFSS